MDPAPASRGLSRRVVIGGLLGVAGLAAVVYIVAARRKRPSVEAARATDAGQADAPTATVESGGYLARPVGETDEEALRNQADDFDNFYIVLDAHAAESDDPATVARYGGEVNVAGGRHFMRDNNRRYRGAMLGFLFDAPIYTEQYAPNSPYDPSPNQGNAGFDAVMESWRLLNVGNLEASAALMHKTCMKCFETYEETEQDTVLIDLFYDWTKFVWQYHSPKKADEMYRMIFTLQNAQGNLNLGSARRMITYTLLIGRYESAIAMAKVLMECTSKDFQEEKVDDGELMLVIVEYAAVLVAVGQLAPAVDLAAMGVGLVDRILTQRRSNVPPGMIMDAVFHLASIFRFKGEHEVLEMLLECARGLAKIGKVVEPNKFMALTALDCTLTTQSLLDETELMADPLPFEYSCTETRRVKLLSGASVAVPVPAALTLFTRGHITHAFCLYGPRNAEGALQAINTAAITVQPVVGLQFREPLGEGPWVYIVGKWTVGQTTHETRWRISRRQTGPNTHITLIGAPVSDGVPAGLHMMLLEAFSSSSEAPSARILRVRQPVWVPLDAVHVTERESRALWRFLDESNGWREVIPISATTSGVMVEQVLRPGNVAAVAHWARTPGANDGDDHID